MIQFADHMPAHCSDEVSGNVLGADPEMGPDSHQVIGHGASDSCLHDRRKKLDQRGILVGQP